MTSAGEPVPIPHGPFHAPPSPTHVIAALRIARGRVFAPRRSTPAYRHVHAIHPVVPAPSHTERSPSAPTCQPHRTLRYRRAPHPTSPIARSLRGRRAPSTPILRRSVLRRRMFHVKHSYVEKQGADGPGARLRLPWPFLYASRPRVPSETRGLLFLRRFGYC